MWLLVKKALEIVFVEYAIVHLVISDFGFIKMLILYGAGEWHRVIRKGFFL